MTSEMFKNQKDKKYWSVIFRHGVIELYGIVPANELPIDDSDPKFLHMQDEDGNEYTLAELIRIDNCDDTPIGHEFMIMDVIRKDGSTLNNTVLAGGALYKLEVLDKEPI